MMHNQGYLRDSLDRAGLKTVKAILLEQCVALACISSQDMTVHYSLSHSFVTRQPGTLRKIAD